MFHLDIFGPVQLTREKDQYNKDTDTLTLVFTIRDEKSRMDKHNQILADYMYRGDQMLMDLFPRKTPKELV